MLPHSFFSVRMFTGHYDHAELLHTRSYNSNFELRRQLDPTIHDSRCLLPLTTMGLRHFHGGVCFALATPPLHSLHS